MRKHKDLFQLLDVALSLLLVCVVSTASINRGSIRGTVTDPQGASIPKVEVKITNIATGVLQTTQTNSAGFYLVPELVPGTYTVGIEHPGFAPVDVANVVVSANDVATVDLQLKLGSSVQRVEVTASTPLVETSAANFSVPVEQRYMQDLPVLGRDIQSLLQLIPGITQSLGPPGSLVGFNGGRFGGFPDATHITGSQVSVSGSQAGGNIWYLDGNLNVAAGSDNVVVNPAPNAVAEFKAVVNGYAAEYGRTAGGVFNVVLKSGSNQIHGDLYENNRNSRFESRNPFAGRNPFGQQNPPNYVNWNQFGGSIGGPVILPHIYDGKNRTFFFASWDVSLLHEKSAGSVYTVPTLLERQGDFSEFPAVRQFGIFDPMSTKYSATLGSFTRQPFLNADGSLATSLPANRIDPLTLYFLNQYPQPNFLDPRQQNAATGGCLNTCNNYESSYASAQNTHSVIIKVNHQINEKNKFFAEWLYNPTDYTMYRLPWTGPTARLQGFNDIGYPWKVTMLIGALGHTVTLSPTLVNEFRFSYSREHNQPTLPPTSLLGWSGIAQKIQGLNFESYPPYSPVPTFSSNVTSFGGTSVLPQLTQAFTFLDNLTKVSGKHTIKAGVLLRDDRTFGAGTPQVSVNFGGSLTSNPVNASGGSGVAQFLLGAVSQGSGWAQTDPVWWSSYSSGYYVQDDYRVTSRFTVNAGLRYDLIGSYKEIHNNASIFDFHLPNPSDPARAGGICYLGTSCHPSGWAFPTHYRDFGPRLNFAYTPFSDQKTVIRGGIDYIYTNGRTQLLGQLEGPSQSPGYGAYGGRRSWLNDATGQGLVGLGVTPAFILSQGAPPLPAKLNAKAANFQGLGPNGSILSQVEGTHDPTATVWNLQVQRELPGNMSISVGYVGNKGDHLIGENNRNYDYIPTTVRLTQRSKLSQLVSMPADLVPFFGQQYFASQLYKPFPQYAGVYNFLSVDDSSIYHGLQTKLEKRYSHGLNFVVAYTYQKTISSGSVGGYLSNTWTGGNVSFASGRGRLTAEPGLSGTGGQNQYQNLDCRVCDRGVTPDHVPHILNVAWTYELPFGPGKPFAGHASGIARLLVQGWKVSPNFNAQVGTPLTINGPCNGVNAAGTGGFISCRANLIGDPNAGRSSKTKIQRENQWWNPNAFEAGFGSDPAIIAVATTGTPAQRDAHDEFWRFGTEGVRPPGLRMPGFWNIDAGVLKDFKVSETKYFQFRWDVYNTLNHQNLGIPNINWCLPPNADGTTDAVHQFGCQFGRITTIQTDPRAMLFGLKFVF